MLRSVVFPRHVFYYMYVTDFRCTRSFRSSFSVCVCGVCYARYDTVHGVFDGEVSHDGENLIVDGTKIKVTSKIRTLVEL